MAVYPATSMSTQTNDAVSITGGTMSGVTTTGGIAANIVKCTASLTKNASTAYADVTGLTFTNIVAGTYRFILAAGSTVASGTGGIKYSFNYTAGMTLTSIASTASGFTASAVAVQASSTATAQADLFTQAAVVISVQITGTMVVATGGTITVQMAQNTSDASNTVALAGSWFQMNRIS